MTVYRCDRCGAIMETELFGFRAGKRECWSPTKEDYLIMDLCADCYISLIDWAEPLPELKKRE